MKNREKEIVKLTEAITAIGLTVEKIEYKPASNAVSHPNATVEVNIIASKQEII
jgi:hypothetical protein